MEPPPPYAPAEFKEFIRNDIDRWSHFVAIVGLDKLKGETAPQ
jgi:hypothetical protein